MPRRAVYDLLYRIGAAGASRGWEVGVGPELIRLVEEGSLSPDAVGGSRAVDLGCGSGDNTIYLAQHGFDAVGVDFSPVAVEQARVKARDADAENATFVVGDIAAERIDGVEGPFDLVVVYNVLQDLRGEKRTGLARNITALTRPGGRALLWCWYAPVKSLPLVSYRGPSRLAPFVIEPGEERTLFGDAFSFERLEPAPGPRKACFVMTRV